MFAVALMWTLRVRLRLTLRMRMKMRMMIRKRMIAMLVADDGREPEA